MAHLLFARDLPCRPVMVGWRWGAQVWRPPTHGARGAREFDPDAVACQSATAADDRASGWVHRRASGSRSAGAAQAASHGASHLGADYQRATGLSDRRVDGASVRADAQADVGAARGA